MQWDSVRVGYGHTVKYYSWLAVTESEKHTSLLRCENNYACNMFYSKGNFASITKLFVTASAFCYSRN
jgi:hypothetical protein